MAKLGSNYIRLLNTKVIFLSLEAKKFDIFVFKVKNPQRVLAQVQTLSNIGKTKLIIDVLPTLLLVKRLRQSTKLNKKQKTIYLVLFDFTQRRGASYKTL